MKLFSGTTAPFSLLSFLLFAVLSQGEAASQPHSPEGQPSEDFKQLAATLLAGTVGGDFQSSFAVREDIDFLLEPAFLVKEVFSEPNEFAHKDLAIRFDARLELGASAGRPTTLFARYWVTPKLYQLVVLWTEPNLHALQFQLPAGLLIQSDRGDFRLHHEIVARANGYYSKPAVRSSPFTYRYGDYPLENLRFADQEAIEEHLMLTAIREMSRSSNTLASNVSIPGYGWQMRLERNEATIQGATQTNRIISFELTDKGRLPKRIEYEYESDRLQRHAVYLPEQQVLVALKSEGAAVKVGTNEYRIKEFPLVYQRGGRTCTAKYAEIKLGNVLNSLPVDLEIRDGKSNRLLRSAALHNFQLESLTTATADEGICLASVDGVLWAYPTIMQKFRGAKTNTSPPDINENDELLQRLDGFVKGAPDSLGQQLAGIRLMIDLSWGPTNSERLVTAYARYLSILERNQLGHGLLASGADIIETAFKQHKFRVCSALLRPWLDSVYRAVNPEAVLGYARKEINRGNPWLMLQLIRKFDSRWKIPEERFEKAALYCLAAYSFAAAAENKTDLAGVLDLNGEQLAQSAKEAFEELSLLADKIGALSRSQTALKERIEKLYKFMSPHDIRSIDAETSQEL